MARYPLTHSQREALLTCPRKFYWRVFLGIRPRETPKALRMGSRVEQVVAGQVPLDDMLAMYAAEAAAMDQPEWERHMHEAHVIGCMIHGYHAYFPPLEGERMAVKFSHPLRSPHTGGQSSTVCTSGEADGVWTDENGRTWLVERKTAASLKTYSGTIRTNVQIAAYVEAIEETEGIELAGVILRVSRKSALRQGKAEGFSDFLARIAAAYEEAPEDYFTEVVLDRFDVPANPPGLGHPQAWAASRLLLTVARELRKVAPEVKGIPLSDYPDALRSRLRREVGISVGGAQGFLDRTADPFPRNHAACSMYGGCRLYALCHSHDSRVLASDFRIGRTLNPELQTTTGG